MTDDSQCSMHRAATKSFSSFLLLYSPALRNINKIREEESGTTVTPRYLYWYEVETHPWVQMTLTALPALTWKSWTEMKKSKQRRLAAHTRKVLHVVYWIYRGKIRTGFHDTRIPHLLFLWHELFALTRRSPPCTCVHHSSRKTHARLHAWVCPSHIPCTCTPLTVLLAIDHEHQCRLQTAVQAIHCADVSSAQQEQLLMPNSKLLVYMLSAGRGCLHLWRVPDVMPRRKRWATV